MSRVGGGVRAGGEIAPRPVAGRAEVLLAGLLCNDAALTETDGTSGGGRSDRGGAARRAPPRRGSTAPTQQEALPRLDAIPFESALPVHGDPARRRGRRRVVYLKGAVETVLERCTAAVGPAGEPAGLDAAAVHRGSATRMAADGLRVLAFARGARRTARSTSSHKDVAGGLTFLGLQAMMDPPRPEAIAAVKACHARRHRREDDHRRPCRDRRGDRPRRSASPAPATRP